MQLIVQSEQLVCSVLAVLDTAEHVDHLFASVSGLGMLVNLASIALEANKQYNIHHNHGSMIPTEGSSLIRMRMHTQKHEVYVESLM